MANKTCPVCGKETNNDYCSRQCRAEAERNYKQCVVCGQKFYCPPANTVYCCGPDCSSKYRSKLAKNRAGNIEHIINQGSLYAKNHQGELHPHAKHYGILTPTGEVIDVLNLHHWVLNCGHFEKPQSAYTAFLNIVGTLKGTASQQRRTHYAGYSIVYYDDGNAANSKANLAEQKYCKVCGTSLPSIKRCYCSEECRKAAIKQRQRENQKNAELKFCKVCGTPLPSIKRCYCSEECRKAAIKLQQKDYRKNKKGDKKMTKQHFHAQRINALDCTDFEQFVAECGGSMPEEYFAEGVDIVSAMQQIWDLAHDFTFRRLCAIYVSPLPTMAVEYGIPLRSMEDWKFGRRKPPEYVLEFLAADVLANRIPTFTED